MAAAILVDSNYYIRRLRNDGDPLLELEQLADRFDFMTCGMVVMEVCRGLQLELQRRRYRAAFAVMNCIPTTNRTWDLATDLALALDRRGTPIPPQDALIAAHALQAGASVLTFDEHFARVPGLRVLDRLR
jgi:predicted nucleic acid-binding protein